MKRIAHTCIHVWQPCTTCTCQLSDILLGYELRTLSWIAPLLDSNVSPNFNSISSTGFHLITLPPPPPPPHPHPSPLTPTPHPHSLPPPLISPPPPPSPPLLTPTPHPYSSPPPLPPLLIPTPHPHPSSPSSPPPLTPTPHPPPLYHNLVTSVCVITTSESD